MLEQIISYLKNIMNLNSKQQITKIVITENEDTHLLNKLYFNQFSLKKLNEQVSLDKKQDYTFDYVESQGAIFTLEDSKKTIIQTRNG